MKDTAKNSWLRIFTFCAIASTSILIQKVYGSDDHLQLTLHSRLTGLQSELDGANINSSDLESIFAKYFHKDKRADKILKYSSSNQNCFTFTPLKCNGSFFAEDFVRIDDNNACLLEKITQQGMVNTYFVLFIKQENEWVIFGTSIIPSFNDGVDVNAYEECIELLSDQLKSN